MVTIKLSTSSVMHERWDIIKSYPLGGQVIIIRLINYSGGVTCTVKKYRKFNKKWKHKIWFKWLKIKVWVGDFYKK